MGTEKDDLNKTLLDLSDNDEEQKQRSASSGGGLPFGGLPLGASLVTHVGVTNEAYINNLHSDFIIY